LGGGAARGFAHIGVLRTLNAHGIRPDVIAGTSIGAVVGGFYAAGELHVFEDWSRQLTRRRMLGYLDFKLGGSGLIGGGRLADRLDDTLGETTFGIEQSGTYLVRIGGQVIERLATIAGDAGRRHIGRPVVRASGPGTIPRSSIRIAQAFSISGSAAPSQPIWMRATAAF
jgi:predicted acylesterase/phospholipase RssA